MEKKTKKKKKTEAEINLYKTEKSRKNCFMSHTSLSWRYVFKLKQMDTSEFNKTQKYDNFIQKLQSDGNDISLITSSG